MNPQHDSLEDFGLWVSQISRMWRAQINQHLAPFGLTEARWLTLLRLSRQAAPVTQKELAEISGVQGPTLVRTLDWLEAEGFIERREIPENRRSKAVHLTDKVKPITDKILTVARRVRADIFADIDARDIATCLKVFSQLGHALDTHNPTLHRLEKRLNP